MKRVPTTIIFVSTRFESESRNDWIERFGEKDKSTGEQNWEDVPANSAMEGLLLPRPPGKDYRLLKVVTQPATAEQFARLGNDRVPVFRTA